MGARLAVFLILAVGCQGGSPRVGTEKGGCYGNKTCNAGLVCLSDVCVKPAGTPTVPTAPLGDPSAREAEIAERAHAAKVEQERLLRETSDWKAQMDAVASELRTTEEETERLTAELARTQDANELARLRSRIEESRRRRAEIEERRKKVEQARPVVRARCADPNDPLCGI